jgi:hypothetical protein
MKMMNITKANRQPNRTIELTVTDPLTVETSTVRYLDIRGGISWPTSKAPAYCCVVGQEYIRPALMGEDDTTGSGKRVLLAEHESNALSMESFYLKLLDLGGLMGCSDFYVTMPDDRWTCGFLHDFDDFSRGRGGSVILNSAYDADNFLLGVTRINQGLGSGNIVIPPDSIVYSQLQDLTRQDLEDSPEERFHAINGMRHVIGSFHRVPPVLAPIVSSRVQEMTRKLGHQQRSFMTS